MKRKILFLVVIACFTALSFGQRRNRTTIQKIIQLTKPATTAGKGFQELLAGLRPTDRFAGQALEKNQIGQLAWAGLGNRINPGIIPVTPSPLESPFPTQIYVVANDGVFYYQPINHSLEQIAEGDARLTLANATSMPVSVSSAGCIMLITSSGTRNSSSRRTGTPTSAKSAMLLEAGHIAQNIQLQAACLEGLGSITISDFDESNVSKACSLPRSADVLYMVCVGYVTEPVNGNSSNAATTKKAAIIVPSENFQDDEFWQTKNMLESAKILVTVVSNRAGPIRGINGTLFDVPLAADRIRADQFDAVIVIGGPGAAMFNNDLVVRDLLRAASQGGKIIGATSYGTIVLASAGILQGIKIACPVELSTDLTMMGAVCSNVPVEEHMSVITCAGPQVARTFATALANGILSR
ncbi:MAG: DJ-1/PfpI family protein [Sedimentisphaerales bacterium]|nr:DJ-1/PfpI family protein [Sedimentisphaerales bacterium]